MFSGPLDTFAAASHAASAAVATARSLRPSSQPGLRELDQDAGVLFVVACIAAIVKGRRRGGMSRRDWYRRVYLRSPHWHGVRAREFSRAGHRCERCGARERLDVHHRHYRRLWREKSRDLKVLCRSCHNRAHGRRS
jgi:5-methylcytosine-specific restriction endonuclease McrA